MNYNKLNTITEPYLHVIQSPDIEMDRMVKELENTSELSIHLIDSRRCTRPNDFFREISEVLNFPDYFGNNWGALVDCFRDLLWFKPNGRLLLFLYADNLLSKSKEENMKIMLETFHEMGKEWSTPDPNTEVPHENAVKPLHSVFHINNARESLFLDRIKNQKLHDLVECCSDSPNQDS